MSAFLGPIHYWLYNKITIQNHLVDDIVGLSKRINIDGLKEELDKQFGVIENKPLEEMIDTTNIHGWLQQCVSIVEYRLAYAITTLLQNDPQNIETLKELFYNAGTRESLFSKDSNVQDIYKVLNDTLLDGMPCDHANTVISQDENEVVWKRTVCVHQQYWINVAGDIKNYYLLREEFIKGMIKNTDTELVKINEETYQIRIK